MGNADKNILEEGRVSWSPELLSGFKSNPAAYGLCGSDW